MFKDFTKYKKWLDYINISNMENKLSIAITAGLLLALKYMKFYDNYSYYCNSVQNLILYSIAGLFGMLGFSLSGIAFVVSVFSSNDTIKLKDEDVMKRVMSSFMFLAFNIGLCIVIYFIMYLFIGSSIEKASKVVFWIVSIFYVYSICFLIFYTIALVRNCVWLYEISESIKKIRKNISKQDLNEIRIDAIISTLVSHGDTDIDQFMNTVSSLVEQSSIDNKHDALDYLRRRYGYKK